ncbi:PQQ-dependent dehydrogenase, methanol/ethanol family [Thermus oshimai]|uniref:PQQ-dependent dehydrogenase, methanol/ethanol family n=1 Tax=Thermus oshimai TaxID=56957 RepID=UPI00036B33BF|nr:PQQ-dependent dehydrogenase, methanol/ethanol family [Thermus oshimai]
MPKFWWFGVFFALLGTAASAQIYSPVTDQRLLNPEPGNWLMVRRTYNGWGYSPLEQITPLNVANLVPVWTYSTGTGTAPLEGLETAPIVNNGIMFITTDRAKVIALNARTGEKFWEYQRQLPQDLRQLHPTNRGVALYGDKVYVATPDCFLVALDAVTGKVVWEQKVEDYQTGYYMTLAPLAAKGKILVGVSGGELGIRGFIQAFDANTGRSLWKTYTIPGPGEPGNETWPGDTWQRGAASIWITGTYDPETNVTYWGTGNGGPWIGDLRPGDNLYTTSVVGLDLDTGAIKTYFQYHWNDSWDWDEVDPPLLVDVTRGGRTVKAAVHPGRNGYLWLLERTGGELKFLDAKPYVFQNVFTQIDPTSGRPTYDPAHKPNLGQKVDFCPSLWGGKDWPYAAFNPKTGLLYIPANENLCGRMEAVEVRYQPGQSYTGARTELYVREGADHIGELQAWDLNTMRKVWTVTFQSPNWGSVLTTGGGLVFMGGTNDRYFRAFDARTGRELWKIRLNSGVIAPPVSYEVDGVQYIAVAAGWGIDAERMQGRLAQVLGWDPNVPKGGVIWVFALRDRVR